MGREQEGKGTQEDCSATWLTVLGFMAMGLVSRLSLANHSDSEWCIHIAQPRWVPVRRILESGRTSDLLAFPEFFWLVVAC